MSGDRIVSSTMSRWWGCTIWLELFGGCQTKSAATHKVVVIDCGQRLIGCCVDEFLGQQNIVVKAIGGYLPQYPYLGGATILGDGQVVLILDGRNLV